MTRDDIWSAEEEAWLRSEYPRKNGRALEAEHNALFGVERTYLAINSRAKVLGLCKVDGYVRREPWFWTGERAAWFVSFVPGHTEPEISAEHERLFGEPLSTSQIGNAKSKFGVRSGTHGGRFQKGSAGGFKDAAHKRRFMEAGKATRFKRGEVHGYAEGIMKPVGTQRLSKDGYIEVKVGEGLQDRPNSNFRFLHHIVWEEANGRPVPPHTMIVFADRDKRNFDPANLVAVPRDVWSVISRTHMQYCDAETLEACVNVARLSRALHAARMMPRSCKRCGGEFKPRFPNQRTCDSCLGRI